ncbi:hypothetical protein, partial [Haloparvum sedimenti]|uniref:hypothetical protein n=1 Tax=Haloparvum sedimenti TaxID=1678448 RepID=UPI001C3FFA23
MTPEGFVALETYVKSDIYRVYPDLEPFLVSYNRRRVPDVRGEPDRFVVSPAAVTGRNGSPGEVLVGDPLAMLDFDRPKR